MLLRSVLVIELLLEHGVRFLHRTGPYLQTGDVVPSELRIGVGYVHCEDVVPDVEAVRHGSQMLEQLDLVVAVVLKPLVEERRVGMIPQEHVGFLEVGDEAENAEEPRYHSGITYN